MPKETRYYNFTLKIDADPAYLNWLEKRLTKIIEQVVKIEDEWFFMPDYEETTEYEAWGDAEIRVITGSHLQLPLPLMESIR